MSQTTNIEWATSTGNPWIGCTKVSPGCKNCYAATMDEQRFSKTMGGGTSKKPISHWGKGAPRVRTKAFWTDAVKWNLMIVCGHCGTMQRGAVSNDEGCSNEVCPSNLSEHVQGFYHPPRIFPSLCDWLDDEVPIEWLADFLKLIHDTPNLDWLLLTKRPENFRKRLQAVLDMETNDEDDFMKTWMVKMNGEPGWALNVAFWIGIAEGMKIEPFKNVWLGVSVEDQKRADERIPLLLEIPAKVRFLSVEPLLEPVSIMKPLLDFKFSYCEGVTIHSVRDRVISMPWIDWVIVGGESGSNRRDCGTQAICDVARQCVAAGVPCFVKQASAHKPGQRGDLTEDIWALKQFPQ